MVDRDIGASHLRIQEGTLTVCRSEWERYRRALTLSHTVQVAGPTETPTRFPIVVTLRNPDPRFWQEFGVPRR